MDYIVSSDQHAGAFNEERWFEEMNDVLIHEVKTHKKLNIVFLSGDWFHKKLSGNSKAMYYAVKALVKLLQICGKKGVKVRMIKGTHSHDNNQLDLFDPLTTSDMCDFKIFRNVDTEVITFEDGSLKVLYLPEEYMVDQEEYYKDYFSDKYDMIIGHGLVDKASFISQVIETETPRNDAPVFKVKDLESICKGPIYFGHIHKRMIVGRFRYVGSHSVWGFGEEEDKGFIKGSMNLSSKAFKDEYVNNDLRPSYITYVYEDGDDLFKMPTDRIIASLLKIASEVDHTNGDKVRFKVNIPKSYDQDIMLTKLLNEVFANIDHVQLMVKNTAKVIEEEENDAEIDRLVEKYYMLFDPSLSYEERLQLFIQIKHSTNIDLDTIKGSIYRD